MNKLTYILCVSLGLTNVTFFSIGFADFTLFHGLLILFCLYLSLVTAFDEESRPKISVSLLSLMIYLPLSNFIFTNSFKGTSLLYSVIIVFEMILMRRIATGLNIDNIKHIVKTVILLHAISIAIGSVCIILGTIPTGFWSVLCQTYNDGRSIRPMGLSSEPSYAALIIIFSLFVLLRSNNLLYKSSDAIWYVLSLAAIVLLASSFGYMMIILLSGFLLTNKNNLNQLLKFLVKNKIIGLTIILVLVISLIYSLTLENKALDRVVRVVSIMSSSGGDIRSSASNILSTDNSASLRILPSIQLVDYFSTANFTKILFGNGAGQATIFYTALHGQLTLLGFFPAFVYNYGILGTFITIFLLSIQFPKKKTILITLVIPFLFNADFNTQIFVYVLFVAMLVKQIEKIENQNLTFTNQNKIDSFSAIS